MSRSLIPAERAILEALLDTEFPGREQLFEQLAHVQVTGPSCNCGCDSVGLLVDRTVQPAEVEDRVPTEGLGRDVDGNEVGVLLHVVDGYMVDLEFYSLSDVKSFGRPRLDSLRTIRWTEPDAQGTRTVEGPPTGS